MNKGILTSLYTSLLILSIISTSVLSEYFLYIRSGACLLTTCSMFCIVFIPLNNLLSKAKKVFRLRFNTIDAIIVLYLLYLIVRYIVSIPSRSAPEKLVFQLVGFISYCIIRYLLNTKNSFRNVYIILVAFGALQGLYALGQRFIGIPNIFDEYPMGGTFGNPGDLANVLVISFAIAIGSLCTLKKSRFYWFAIMLVLLLLTSIILSNARTSWIAVSCVMFFFLKHKLVLVFQLFKRTLITKYSIIIGLVVVCGFIAIKLFNYKQDSSNGRLFIWKQSFELIAEKPFFGHGYDSFIPEYLTAQMEYFKTNLDDVKNGFLVDNIVFCYNDFIQLAVEYGLLGLLIFLYLLYKAFKVAYNRFAPIARIAIGTLFGIIISMFFSYPLQNGVILLVFYILLAVISSHDQNTLFDFSFNKILQRNASMLLSIIFISSLITSLLFIKTGCDWKESYERYLSNEKNYLSEYHSNLKILRYDKFYLYHHGSILFLSGEYKQCIEHFEKYYSLCLNSNMLMLLAESYELNSDTLKAEETYSKASNMVPNLYVPKHKLFQLYNKTCQLEKAHQIALNIQEMPIKVFSKTVIDIKTEINQYLLYAHEYDNCK